MIIGSGITIGSGISLNVTLPTPILNLDAATYSGSGTTWFDISGSENDFILTGSPTYTNIGGYHVYKWTGSGSITF